jgi:Asp-tRNA(Asn)/Glu-tRNA(Gln) amidotransferase A subunit family amidase
MERMVKAAIALIRSASRTETDWLPGLARFPAARVGPLERTPILEISMSRRGSALQNLDSDGRSMNPYNLRMADSMGSIGGLRQGLADGVMPPRELAERALARANQNAGRNTYLWQDAAWTRSEAARAEAMPRGTSGHFRDGRTALWGLPISVKDCFDLAGAPTTCGVRFYRDLNGTATRDSWLVERLRAAGAVIVGKTHLHPLAYGITGENPEFGDCVQPGDPAALTGGSSSGAAASVLEGSAVAAIGTDTGGSVRVPAVLCGLAGYRSTLGRGDWRGGAHLAESFDTMGWLFRDLKDAPLLAAPFAADPVAPAATFTRFAFIADSFLHDCDLAVVGSLSSTVRDLETMGLEGRAIDPEWWQGSIELFAPIQAWEAARLHAGHYDHFEAPIRERLEWGARISALEIADLRRRLAEFRARMDDLFATHELLLMPCAPVARLAVGTDHGRTRARLLRYTTPVSLAGAPAVAIPCAAGGMQLAAAPGNDEALLDLAARLGVQRNSTDSL